MYCKYNPKNQKNKPFTKISIPIPIKIIPPKISALSVNFPPAFLPMIIQEKEMT